MLRVAFMSGLAAAVALPAALAVASPVQWRSGTGANGHFYEFVASDADWTVAYAAAQAMMLGGEQGYLVSIHSAAENDFVYRLLSKQQFPFQAAAWLGGFQTPPFPEVSPRLDWNWTSGEDFSFANWYAATGEPNNFGGNENFLQMYNYGRGGWNDCTVACENNRVGFLVEYAGSLPPGGVPEPATWVGLVIGFGFVGGMARAGRLTSLV